jgi:hypothetical protein
MRSASERGEDRAVGFRGGAGRSFMTFRGRRGARTAEPDSRGNDGSIGGEFKKRLEIRTRLGRLQSTVKQRGHFCSQFIDSYESPK